MGTSHHRRTHLFLVRLWAEDVGDDSGRVEWRGKVQRVVDGETHPFSGWPALVDLLLKMLSDKRWR